MRLLLAAGAQVYAYDPEGVKRAKQLFPEGRSEQGTMNYVSDARQAIEGANICFVFTEWPQIREIMHTPLVYDGRNLYDPVKMKEAGVEYYSIGR